MLTAFKRQQRAQPFHYSALLNLEAIPPTFPLYEFGGCQETQAFVNSPARVKAIFGGNKSGKTHVNVYRQLIKIRENPGCTTWAATKTGDMVGQTLWKKYEELIDPSEIKDIAWSNHKKGIPSMVRWWNDSTTWFKTYEQGWETFQSADVHDILLDEECDAPIYKECLPRLLKYHGQLGLSMTPLKGKTWPYHRIDQNNIPGQIESWRVSLFMNPFLAQAEKDEIIEIYGADEIDRRVYGLFVILEGAVFKEFDDRVHVLKEEPVIDAGWRRIRVIDLGATVFCCLWLAMSPKGTIYIFDEYYHEGGRVITEHASEIKRITESHYSQMSNLERFRPVEVSLSDHEKQTRIDLDANGIPTTPADKRVELGVEYVNQFLKFSDTKEAQLFISPRCPNTAREFGIYHYKPVKDGFENKEVIAKLDDHTCDDARYGCIYFKEGRRRYDVQQ